jgi:Domain of unknown function (DUF4439)
VTGNATAQKIAALQAALAAEQAASYAYGVVGAHLTGSKFNVAAADCLVHQRARDSLTAMVSALGAQPHPAAVAYQLPAPVTTAAQAASLAASLEREVAAAYLGLVAVPDPALRTFAAARMQDASVRAVRWSGDSQAFPGLSA